MSILRIKTTVGQHFVRLLLILTNKLELDMFGVSGEARRFDALNSVAAIVTTDSNGRISCINKKMSDLSGFSEGEIVGQNLQLIGSFSDSTELIAMIREAANNNQIWHGEFENRRRDNSVYWVYCIALPCFLNNEIFEISVLLFDISEFKNNGIKSDENVKPKPLEIVFELCHELNNVLSVVVTTLDLFRLKIFDLHLESGSELKSLDRAQRAAKHASALVRQSLSYAKNEDLGSFNRVSLKSLIEEAVDVCVTGFDTHSVALKIGEIPNVEIDCRSTGIKQILINLLKNALYAATPLREKWVQVDVFFSREGRVKIAITDSGNGILGSVRDKVMQAYFTTKPLGDGTGLGLAVSKRIVEEHSGTIAFDHDFPNTRVVVELPIRRF